MMYRARVVFKGGAILYSVEKATEHGARELLTSMGGALNHAESLTLQEHPAHDSTRGSGWHDMEMRTQ